MPLEETETLEEMTNPLAPPPKKKKMTNFPPPPPPPPLFHLPSSSPSFSSVPDEIVVSCLSRIPRFYYRSLCLVSKSFYSLLSSPEMYAARSQIRDTELCFYMCLWSTTLRNLSWFTLMNPVEGALSLAPVSLSSSNAPAQLKSATVTVGFEIYQIGGTVANKRSKAVRVFDCRNHTWRRAPNLTVARKHAKSCFLDGKIYVTGGEEESMNWVEVFDIKTQTWKPLPSLTENGFDPNEYQVVVFGARLYVITRHNKYAYDPKEGRWLLEMGFVGLEEAIVNRPFCVIENVMFAEHGGKYKWYDTRYGMWVMVKNLDILYANRVRVYKTFELVNHGGKLVIIWHELILDRGIIRSQDKKIWCAVIRLEERSLSSSGLEIWGEVERCNLVVPTVPKYRLLACLSVTV